MAKRIDTSNLTVDFRQLMKMTVQDRVDFYKSGGQSYFESLTPTQLAQLFPKYYQKQLPDIGKAVSGGTVGTAPSAAPEPRTGGGITSGALGRAARSQAAPGQPQQSSTAQENAFLKYLEGITGKKGQQTFASPTGFGIDRSRFKAELENNPELAKRLMSLAKAEVGSQGTVAQQKWMETIFNRAYAQGKSISAVIDPNNGYWPKGQKRPQLSDSETETYMGTLNRVLSGSNESNYATDNASAGLARRREQSGRKGSWESGEFFYTDFQYRKAMEKLKQETEQRAATTAQKPEQERPSQSGAPTGLTPGSPVPGRQQPVSDKDRADFYSNLYARGGRIGGVSSNFDSFQGLCGKGTRGLAGALLNDSHFSKGLSVGGSANAGSLATNNNYLQMSGLYNERQQVSAEKIKSKEYLDSLPIGTVIASHNDGRGPGHVQIKVGPGQWVSDKRQGNVILESGTGGAFTGFAVITPNQAGIQKLDPRIANDPSTIAWAAQQGYSLNEQQQQIAAQQPSTAPTLPLPSDFNSWNPKLQEYFKSLPTAIQQNILKQNEHLKEQGKNINDFYEAAIKNGVIPNRAAKETVTAVNNTPPGELPQVNPAGFGVGMIHGEQKYTPEQEKDRPGYSTGRIKFTGFEDTDLTQTEFQAGSGGREKDKPSVPSGTYSLTPQATGPVISDYYRSRGIDPNQGAFGRVYNVGTPKAPTVAGYDPKVQRTRTQIQIHSNVNKDVDKLISSGCITVSPDEYPRLVESIERARKASKSGISLVVQNNPDGTSSFTIMPSARATNPITVNTAVRNVQETGNIAGIPQAAPEQQPTQTGTPPTQVITPSPQTTGSSKPQPVTPVTPVTPAAPATPAPAAPQAQPAPAAPQARPAPAAPQAQPQPISAPAAPQPAATATPVQEAPPRQEDQVKPNAVGGQEQTTENILFSDSKTGKFLGTAQRGEVVALNESGVAEIKPEQRISEIPQLRSDMPQQQNTQPQYEPEQQTMRTNMAAMTASPPSVPSAQENFYDVSDFFISESYKRAMMAYNKFQTTDRKIDNGSNTLFT